MQRENKWQDRLNKMVDIIANIAFTNGKGLNSNELNEINAQLELFIQSEIDTARAEERVRIVEALKKSLKEEQKYLSLESSYGEGVYEGLVHSIHLVETFHLVETLNK